MPQRRFATSSFKNNQAAEDSPGGLIKETLLNAACALGAQWHGLRYLTLS
jgi:hypothetical protein